MAIDRDLTVDAPSCTGRPSTRPCGDRGERAGDEEATSAVLLRILQQPPQSGTGPRHRGSAGLQAERRYRAVLGRELGTETDPRGPPGDDVFQIDEEEF